MGNEVRKREREDGGQREGGPVVKERESRNTRGQSMWEGREMYKMRGRIEERENEGERESKRGRVFLMENTPAGMLCCREPADELTGKWN